MLQFRAIKLTTTAKNVRFIHNFCIVMTYYLLYFQYSILSSHEVYHMKFIHHLQLFNLYWNTFTFYRSLGTAYNLIEVGKLTRPKASGNYDCGQVSFYIRKHTFFKGNKNVFLHPQSNYSAYYKIFKWSRNIASEY